MVELVDTTDLKSVARMGVRVRVPVQAPDLIGSSRLLPMRFAEYKYGWVAQ